MQEISNLGADYATIRATLNKQSDELEERKRRDTSSIDKQRENQRREQQESGLPKELFESRLNGIEALRKARVEETE